MSRPLRVWLNGFQDGRSFHVDVPYAVDTLEELCRLLSHDVPFPPLTEKDGITRARERSFRFLYSADGKPLWRVSECLALGSIVASERAGFNTPQSKQVEKRQEPTPHMVSSVTRVSASPIPDRPVPRVPLFHQTEGLLSTIERKSLRTTLSERSEAEAATRQSSTTQLALLISHRVVRFPLHVSSPAVLHWSTSGCELFLTRKWRAFQKVRHNGQLIGIPTLHRRIDGLAEHRRGTKDGVPLRIVFSGPPSSGVSTLAAMFVRELLEDANRAEKVFPNATGLVGHLLVPLDTPLLNSSVFNAADADLITWCEVVVRICVDAVVATRSDLRLQGVPITNLWIKMLHRKEAISGEDPLVEEVRRAVGSTAVKSWMDVVPSAALLLSEAVHSPDDEVLKESCVQFVVRGIAEEMASSLGYIGVVYIIDDFEPQTSDPFGLGLLSKVFDTERTPHVHTLLCSSSMALQPLTASYISGVSTWIKTIGFLDQKHHDYRLPDHFHCFSQTFSASIFLWAPGYVAAIRSCLESFRGSVEPQPVEAIDDKHQHSGSCVRLDFKEVEEALTNLRKLVASGFHTPVKP